MKTNFFNRTRWQHLVGGTQETTSVRAGQGDAIPIVSLRYPYSNDSASLAHPLREGGELTRSSLVCLSFVSRSNVNGIAA